MLRNLLRSLVCALLAVLLSAPPAGAQEETETPARLQAEETDFLPIPTAIAKLREVWQRLREAQETGQAEVRDSLTREIIRLRHRAGILGSEKWARSFAMLGWKYQIAGQLEAAVREFQTAVQMAPNAKEYRVALAAALAARNPLDLLSYVPQCAQAVSGSLDTLRGRYFLLMDLFLWAGMALFLSAVFWGLAMSVSYAVPTFHTMQELLSKLFEDEMGTLLAAVAFAAPLAFGVHIGSYALGFFIITFAFQKRAERIVSSVGIALAWLGLALIALSSQTAGGMTTLPARAAFVADRHDGDEMVLAELEKSIMESGLPTDLLGAGSPPPATSESPTEGRLEAPSGEENPTGNESDAVAGPRMQSGAPPAVGEWGAGDRVRLYLYALNLRKLGRTRGIGGVGVESLFASLGGADDLGRFAAINRANIALESGDFIPARETYQSALTNSAARPYALYNLWRLNLLIPTPSIEEAEGFKVRLVQEFPEFAARFEVGDLNRWPSLIDAGLPPELEEALVSMGLASANGPGRDSVRLSDLLWGNLLGPASLWVVVAGVGFAISALLLHHLGLSALCRGCGKPFSRHYDLDPKRSRFCQSCTAATSKKGEYDAELRRLQLDRIETHKKRRRIGEIAGNVIVPGLGFALTDRPVLGGAFIALWSMLVALVYGIDRFPRLDPFPFYSHWTALVIFVCLLLAAAAYGGVLLLTLSRKSSESLGRFKRWS